MRHTYASMSIAAGVSLFELSRLMGTSPAMLDKTYGHMLPDALDRARSALDLREVARKQRVDQGIDTLLVEDEIGAQVPFAPEARLLQDALRSNVGWHNECLETGKPCTGHPPPSEESDCT
jgi:hypothetical protein